MTTAQIAFIFLLDDHGTWGADWVWGCPLIVLTVIIHVLGLGSIGQKVILIQGDLVKHRHRTAIFSVVVGTTTLLATVLHGIETGFWAVAYVFIGALPDFKSAMLFSLDAITSYGHANLELEQHWHLLGSLEALNGWLLFGLTTAFLFGMLEEVWRSDSSLRL